MLQLNIKRRSNKLSCSCSWLPCVNSHRSVGSASQGKGVLIHKATGGAEQAHYRQDHATENLE